MATPKAPKTPKVDAGTSPSPKPPPVVSVAPSITLLQPATATAGTSLSISIFGAGFGQTPSVEIGGTVVPAQLQAGGSLLVKIPDAKLVSPGSLGIQVAVGAARSNTSFFIVSSTVLSTTLTSLSPSTTVANPNASPLLLRLTGSGFTPSARVLIGGQEQTTTFESATSLTTNIPAELLRAPTTHAVAVKDGVAVTTAALNFQVTPAANGGTCETTTDRSACLTGGCGWIEPAGPCIVAPGGGGGGGGNGCDSIASRTSCLNSGCGWVEANGPCIDPNGGGGGGGGVCGGQSSRTSCLNSGCGWIEPAGPCIN